ncbi:hypothetical protein [Mucilaginibacter lacusdianchii]|uniref:hypothetical protein n=1 Tax=Mucilaginibacter lacusdianchii TaxID=2684211 RepID=UPI00131BC7B8|nr:hypothetical protein [Mucilaginibacter sp. JXJ CY 39]
MQITIQDYVVFKQGEADVRQIQYNYTVSEENGEQWGGYANIIVSGSLFADWVSHFKTRYNEEGFDDEFAKFGLKVIEKEIWQYVLNRKEPIIPIKFTYYTQNAPKVDFVHHQILKVDGYVIEE